MICHQWVILHKNIYTVIPVLAGSQHVRYPSWVLRCTAWRQRWTTLWGCIRDGYHEETIIQGSFYDHMHATISSCLKNSRNNEEEGRQGMRTAPFLFIPHHGLYHHHLPSRMHSNNVIVDSILPWHYWMRPRAPTLLASISQEYLARHQVIERFNSALESLFECETLPEDPLSFICDQMSKPSSGWERHPYSMQHHLTELLRFYIYPVPQARPQSIGKVTTNVLAYLSVV